MDDLAGLNRWERYWCRRSAFGMWRHAEWVGDAFLVAMIASSAWVVYRGGNDSHEVSFAFIAGIGLGAVLARNLPIRADRVIGRLTRALESRGPRDQA